MKKNKSFIKGMFIGLVAVGVASVFEVITGLEIVIPFSIIFFLICIFMIIKLRLNRRKENEV